MSMNIMWKRYHESEITPADFVARDIFNNAEYYAFKKSPENFSGNEHTEKFIVPIIWENILKIHGLVAPLNFPILADANLSFKDAKESFLVNWKKMWGGEFFWDYLWVVKETVKNSKSEEIQSYINWKNSSNRQQLAFIYLGIFWMYKDETETLNQAAQRFFEEHSGDALLQNALNHELEKKYWKETSNKYIKAILNDGALLFDRNSKKVFSKIHDYGDPATVVWKSLCILGYFPWVSRMDFFTEWDYDDYLSR